MSKQKTNQDRARIQRAWNYRKQRISFFESARSLDKRAFDLGNRCAELAQSRDTALADVARLLGTLATGAAIFDGPVTGAALRVAEWQRDARAALTPDPEPDDKAKYDPHSGSNFAGICPNCGSGMGDTECIDCGHTEPTEPRELGVGRVCGECEKWERGAVGPISLRHGLARSPICSRGIQGHSYYGHHGCSARIEFRDKEGSDGH